MSAKKVAVIGLGDISGIYLKNIARVFQNIELYGVCTHRVERAREVAAEYGASKVYETMEQAFADPEVDIVVNLTRPMEHLDVTMKALQAGKHRLSVLQAVPSDAALPQAPDTVPSPAVLLPAWYTAVHPQSCSPG